nr:MAG TPA: hypothetical protein [Caudoviricetes sp.]
MLRRGGLWANEEPLYLLYDAFGDVFELRSEVTSKRRGFFYVSYFYSRRWYFCLTTRLLHDILVLV